MLVRLGISAGFWYGLSYSPGWRAAVKASLPIGAGFGIWNDIGFLP